MNKLKYIVVLFLSLSFTSCNDWLNITPKGQVESSQLLKDVKGYNAAMNGVYYTMSSENLYGRNLTFGSLDVLAQYWRVNSKNTYFDLQSFKYESANSISKTDLIWGEMFIAIGQCNHILQSLNENGNIIEDSYLFKGEATALRAFLHFDVLRLYGPVLRNKSDFDKPAIPYRTTFDNIAIKFNTSTEIIAKIREDLLTALEILNDDPIKINGRRGNANQSLMGYNSVMDRRGSRMNYFGILGLLSRLELYAGNKTKAYEYTQRVIKECEETKVQEYSVIHFTNKSDFDNSSEVFRDIACSSEMLFSLYVNNLWLNSGNLFGYKDYSPTVANRIDISSTQYTNILKYVYGRVPDGAGTDYRIKYWFNKQEAPSALYEFVKVKKPQQAGGTRPPFYPDMAIIRLSEIYYIAAETQIGVDNIKALEYLNKVRDFRGLTAIDSKNVNDELVMMYLTRECRKEFFGDGQMFYFYKRLFKEIEVADKVKIDPIETNFVLPIPNNEYEFSPNQKPETNQK